MLLTKLHRPPLSLEHVFRFRLIDELNKNMYKPFSLVCAPAGYGKSMVISSWLESSKYKYIWISLADSENDLKEFLDYQQIAIQNSFPNALSAFTDLIQSTKLPPIELLSDTLVNELDQITEDCVLVLDDYLRSMFPDKEFYATIEYDKNPVELREESLVIKQGNTSVMIWYNDITAINSEKMYDAAAGMNDIKITFTTVARGE